MAGAAQPEAVVVHARLLWPAPSRNTPPYVHTPINSGQPGALRSSAPSPACGKEPVRSVASCEVGSRGDSRKFLNFWGLARTHNWSLWEAGASRGTAGSKSSSASPGDIDADEALHSAPEVGFQTVQDDVEGARQGNADRIERGISAADRGGRPFSSSLGKRGKYESRRPIAYRGG